MPVDVVERARRYVRQMDPSVSGSGGHTAAFKVACALVNGFSLDEEAAREVFVSEFNGRCQPPWSEKEIAHKLRQAAMNSGGKLPGYLLGGSERAAAGGGWKPKAGPVPEERLRKRQAYDAGKLKRAQTADRIGRQWLAERSPVAVAGVTPGAFLDALYAMGEKVLVFDRFRSQGQFVRVAGAPGETWGLPARPGGKPVAADIPETAREGVWFLAAPVDGRWHAMPGKVDERGNPVQSRRSGRSVTAWRYMVLESDDAPALEWLNLLVQLPLPVAALYTSGGRSVHALVKIEAKTKQAFDGFRDSVTPLLSRLGADPAAISGVRLTRLPGCMREGSQKKAGYARYDAPRLQRLLYLNPRPEVAAMKSMPRIRRVGKES